MIAGGDCCGAAWEGSGCAVHQAFGLLAEVGLRLLRILRMTTRGVAKFLDVAT